MKILSPQRLRFSPLSVRHAAVALTVFGLCAGAGSVGAEPVSSADRPVIQVKHTDSVKVVVQVKTGDFAEGVSKGLFRIKKLRDGFLESGVDPENLKISAVVHGDAADHLLTNSAWRERLDKDGDNPSTNLISELVEGGVQIELCNGRRVKNGWEKSEIHPDVLLVSGAYLRIVDLQNEGYAYVQL